MQLMFRRPLGLIGFCLGPVLIYGYSQHPIEPTEPVVGIAIVGRTRL